MGAGCVLLGALREAPPSESWCLASDCAGGEGTHLLVFSLHHWNSCKESCWSWCSSLCVTSGQPVASKRETHRGSQGGLWWLSFLESLLLPSLVWKEWVDWWARETAYIRQLFGVSIIFGILLMPFVGKWVCNWQAGPWPNGEKDFALSLCRSNSSLGLVIYLA